MAGIMAEKAAMTRMEQSRRLSQNFVDESLFGNTTGAKKKSYNTTNLLIVGKDTVRTLELLLIAFLCTKRRSGAHLQELMVPALNEVINFSLSTICRQSWR